MTNPFCGLTECSILDGLHQALAILFAIAALFFLALKSFIYKMLVHLLSFFYMKKIESMICVPHFNQSNVAKLLGLPMFFLSPAGTKNINAHWVYTNASIATPKTVINEFFEKPTSQYMERTGTCLHVMFDLNGYVQCVYWKRNSEV